MYATCLFCNNGLGRNEALESFPVGQRLAFDQAKGRLWVVCAKCERWNLTPLEERWEAIEQAERLYRDARRRVATDNVGLAKLRDGTTIVRIGAPLRPEFAAWRYGDQFGRRRRKQLLVAVGGVAIVGGVFTGIAAAGVAVTGFAWMFMKSGRRIISGNPEEIVATIRTDSAGLVQVRRRHLNETVLGRASDGEMALHLRFKDGSAAFTGREAERIAAVVLPTVNRYGGSKRAVAEAVSEIEDAGSAEAYVKNLTRTEHDRATQLVEQWQGAQGGTIRVARMSRHGLFGIPGTQRLALEMALHEEAERRAMQGELEELERAWQEAEEIAAISDNLLVPSSLTEAFSNLKREA